MMLIMSRTMKKADVDDGQNVQFGGVAYVTDRKYVMFCPDDPVPGVVSPFNVNGKGMMMRDGTFDFVPHPKRAKRGGTLLKKVTHGRLSATKDGAYLLTLKVFKCEALDAAAVMSSEAREAIEGGFSIVKE